jgi:hypothetical protein
MMFKDTDVSTHSSVDNSDPGFAIKGFRLRWVSGVVEVRRAGRIWQPLKFSMLPSKVLQKLKDTQPGWFSSGDVIRRRDLVLSFAPIALVEERRKLLRKNQDANEAVFRGRVNLGHGVETEASNRMALEKVETSEEFS